MFENQRDSINLVILDKKSPLQSKHTIKCFLCQHWEGGKKADIILLEKENLLKIGELTCGVKKHLVG